MTQRVKSVAMQSAPWRKGIAWPIVLAEGIAALVLGAVVLVATTQAQEFVTWLVGLFLLVRSGSAIFALQRNRAPGVDTRLPLIRAVIGLIGGAIIFLRPIFGTGTLSLSTAYTILGITLIVFGSLGIFIDSTAPRVEGEDKSPNLILDFGYIAFGIILMILIISGWSLMPYFGVLAIVAGVALLVYAERLRRASIAAAEAIKAASLVPAPATGAAPVPAASYPATATTSAPPMSPVSPMSSTPPVVAATAPTAPVAAAPVESPSIIPPVEAPTPAAPAIPATPVSPLTTDPTPLTSSSASEPAPAKPKQSSTKKASTPKPTKKTPADDSTGGTEPPG